MSFITLCWVADRSIPTPSIGRERITVKPAIKPNLI